MRRAGPTSALIATAALLACGAPEAGAAPLYGVTVDTVSHVARTAQALAALPYRATARVYFDVSEPASFYRAPLETLAPDADVMGELLDSSDETKIAVAPLRERAREYVSHLGPLVSIWEVGNEVNGSWTGPYQQVDERLTAAWETAHAAGDATALTLYANNFGPDNCGDGSSELTPVQFSESYVPPEVAAGLNYVLLSFYPTQCHGHEPSAVEVAQYMQRLHALYPNAMLGFGEVGLPHPARHTRVAKAAQIMRWAYGLDPGLPYYVGGYFWWYAVEDALAPGAPLAGTLAEAFEAEHGALGG
jgi:hypothetical protein